MQRWYDARNGARQVRAVACGVNGVSAIERAVGAGAESDDFEDGHRVPRPVRRLPMATALPHRGTPGEPARAGLRCPSVIQRST